MNEPTEQIRAEVAEAGVEVPADLRSLNMGDAIRFSPPDDGAPAGLRVIGTRLGGPLRARVGVGCLMLREGRECITIWFKDAADFEMVQRIVKEYNLR